MIAGAETPTEDSDDACFEFSPFGYVVRSYGDVAIQIGSERNRGHYKGNDFDEKPE